MKVKQNICKSLWITIESMKVEEHTEEIKLLELLDEDLKQLKIVSLGLDTLIVCKIDFFF
jgi:hypothetical protein